MFGNKRRDKKIDKMSSEILKLKRLVDSEIVLRENISRLERLKQSICASRKDGVLYVSSRSAYLGEDLTIAPGVDRGAPISWMVWHHQVEKMARKFLWERNLSQVSGEGGQGNFEHMVSDLTDFMVNKVCCII